MDDIKETTDRKPAYHHGDLRQALLDAAEVELAEKGVEGFTLRGCAKRAGVSHAAPAHHFRDANALLSELAAEGFSRFSKAMRDRQAGRPRDSLESLIGAGLGYIDFARAHPALFRLMFSSNRPDFGHEPLRRSADEAFGILVSTVAGSTGKDPTADREGLSDIAAAWAMAHGLADLLLSGRLPVPGASAESVNEEILAAIMARALR